MERRDASIASGARRLQGRLLPLLGASWVIVALFTVALFIAGAPPLFAQLRTPCAGPGCYRWQLAPAAIEDLRPLGLSLRSYAVCYLALEALCVLASFAVSLVIVRRRADEPMALFGAIVLVTFGGTVFTDTSTALVVTDTAWAWLARAMGCLGTATLFIFFFLFPDGRFVPRWTGGVAALWVAVAVLGYLAPPVPMLDATDTTNGMLFPLLALGCFGSVATAQVVRYRRVSTPTQRQQTKWVIFGFIAALVGILADILLLTPLRGRHGGGLAYHLIAVTGFSLCLLLIPLSIAVAILRYRLWDIDLLINRTLVYGALTLCVVGLYLLVVVALGALLRAHGNPVIALVATGLVTALFQPLRGRVQQAVNRLMYGERDDPYAALSRLGRQLEETLAPDAVLPAICQTVREALRLPYVAVAIAPVGQHAITAASGTPVVDPLRVPLIYQHDAVGELLLAPRAPGERFGPADRRLLDDLARQVGVAAHAHRLTADLQRSRERLVMAREEERRRLRRDLHDGLGPTLGSLTLKLGVADDLLERDPAAARAILRSLKAQTQSAIADIRGLVYALRPPALDDLGLVAALREEAVQLEQSGLRIAVDAPACLPPLPAAVEVAAYRIAQEALTNVVRHARARHCIIRLTLDEATGALVVAVCDDGVGLLATHGQGVGLTSMRERAAELGGLCVIEPQATGGTRMRASLPCHGFSGVGTMQQRAYGASTDVAPQG